MNRIVTLIGYRGVGKSTVAPLLAKHLKWTCVDSDVEVEQQTKRSIAEIFSSDGEAEFRRMERKVVQELLEREDLVLSAGGGAILNADTRRDLKQSGPVVWLQASLDTVSYTHLTLPTKA